MARSIQHCQRFQPELYRDLVKEAKARGITLSALIRVFLTNALKPGTLKEPEQSSQEAKS